MALIPTTLQVLITNVRQRTNMENNQFVVDAEIINYLNDSLSVLDAILVSKFDKYKLTKVILSVNAGTSQISLPNDFLKLAGMDVWLSNGQADGYITMNEYSWEQRNKKVYPSGGNLLYSPYHMEYHLEGQTINILPPQTAANFSYRVSYVPDFIALVNATDTLQSYMDTQNWRQYAVYDVAAQVLAKQDLDPSFFMAKANELKEVLIKLATPNRNQGEPKSVSDTRNYDNGMGGYGWGWIYGYSDIDDNGEYNALSISDNKWDKW